MPDSMGLAPDKTCESDGVCLGGMRASCLRNSGSCVWGGYVTMLQAAEVHNCSSNFVVEIELRMHLHWVVKVDTRKPSVAKEEGTAGELLAQAHLR